MPQIKGVVPGIGTPFTWEDEFDEKAYRASIEYYIQAGVNGLFPLGTVGQGPHMTIDERMKAAEVMMDQVKGRIAVVMQIGTADTRSTIILAKHAEKLKVDAIGVLPLYYGKASDEAVVNHFKAVSAAVPLPIFMYDNFGTTQFKTTPKFLERLLREVPMVKGCKMSSTDMVDKFMWLRAIPKDFIYLDGYTEFLPTVVPLGAKGIMSPRIGQAPELFVDTWKTIEQGDWNVSIPKLMKMWNIFKTIDSIAGREAEREILRLRGVPVQKMPRNATTRGAAPEVIQKLMKFMLENGIPVKQPAGVA